MRVDRQARDREETDHGEDEIERLIVHDVPRLFLGDEFDQVLRLPKIIRLRFNRR